MNNRIQFVDLKRQYATIKDEMDEVLSQVIQSGVFVGGRVVDQFEENFARFCGTRFAIGVANGTDALQLALRGMGIGPGDEVITVPNTFIATISAIINCGASVIFCDIDPRTYCLNPENLESLITSRTKAVLPVHLYGHPVDMDPVLAIAARHNLYVLEDACQAHGSFYKDRRAGNTGHAAAFSFYPGKNLGAYGDGGAVTTSDPILAEKIRLLRDHGRTDKYEHSLFGYNSRLDSMQAAVLNVKLKYLDKWNSRRREIALMYNKILSGLPGLEIPYEAPYATSVYHLYVIRTSERTRFQAALDSEGIGNGIHYPVPIHLQPAWANFGDRVIGPGAFPLVERYAGEILSLPMHPDITDEEVEFTAAVIRKAASPETSADLQTAVLI